MKAFPNTRFAEGMDLRDYFAAKAMQCLLEKNWEGLQASNQKQTTELVFAICSASYAMADAMMKEREE